MLSVFRPEPQTRSARRGSSTAHVHIWDPTVLEYSWLEGELNRPYLPAEYQAGAPATTGVIFVEAGPVGKADEVAWAESLGWPALLGVVAHAPLEKGSGVVAELAALREAGRTVGIRRLLQDEPLSFFENPALLEGLRALASSRAAVRCVHPAPPACCPYRACLLLGFRSCQLCSITSPSRRLQAVTTGPGSGTYER